jgi:hypothetical protein
LDERNPDNFLKALIPIGVKDWFGCGVSSFGVLIPEDIEKGKNSGTSIPRFSSNHPATTRR